MIVTEEQARKMRCCGPEGCGLTVERRIPINEGCDHAFEGSRCRRCLVTTHEWQAGRAILERFCIGSACMAWRRNMPKGVGQFFHVAENPSAQAEPARPAGVPASWIWAYHQDDGGANPAGWTEPESEAWERVAKDAEGQCGLAYGRPA